MDRWYIFVAQNNVWIEGEIMLFQTIGNELNPVILFFHAMGVTGESSMPIAEKLSDKYYCVMPTSTVYCSNQKYLGKSDEIQQIKRFLSDHGIKEIELVVASSIGADLAMVFLTDTKIPVKHIFFDGGQFAQIGKITRRIMVPFLYVAMKSLYWTNGKTLKKIMWCDDDNIKPYFVEAGKNLSYTNLRKQMDDSLEDNFKYRNAVMQAYKYGNFPVFEGLNHMEYQIRYPDGFARMLEMIIKTDQLPELTF